MLHKRPSFVADEELKIVVEPNDPEILKDVAKMFQETCKQSSESLSEATQILSDLEILKDVAKLFPEFYEDRKESSSDDTKILADAASMFRECEAEVARTEAYKSVQFLFARARVWEKIHQQEAILANVGPFFEKMYDRSNEMEKDHAVHDIRYLFKHEEEFDSDDSSPSSDSEDNIYWVSPRDRTPFHKLNPFESQGSISRYKSHDSQENTYSEKNDRLKNMNSSDCSGEFHFKQGPSLVPYHSQGDVDHEEIEVDSETLKKSIALRQFVQNIERESEHTTISQKPQANKSEADSIIQQEEALEGTEKKRRSSSIVKVRSMIGSLLQFVFPKRSKKNTPKYSRIQSGNETEKTNSSEINLLNPSNDSVEHLA